MTYLGNTTVIDALSIAAWHDCCLVMPSFDLALRDWPVYRDAFDLHHQTWCTIKTKTAIVTRCNHRVMRLWIPIPLHLQTTEGELPMDYKAERLRDQWYFFSPYYNRRDLRAVVEAT